MEANKRARRRSSFGSGVVTSTRTKKRQLLMLMRGMGLQPGRLKEITRAGYHMYHIIEEADTDRVTFERVMNNVMSRSSGSSDTALHNSAAGPMRPHRQQVGANSIGVP